MLKVSQSEDYLHSLPPAPPPITVKGKSWPVDLNLDPIFRGSIQFSRTHDPLSSMCRLEAFFSSMILQKGLSSIESSIALIQWSLSSWVAAAILQWKKNGENAFFFQKRKLLW